MLLHIRPNKITENDKIVFAHYDDNDVKAYTRHKLTRYYFDMPHEEFLNYFGFEWTPGPKDVGWYLAEFGDKNKEGQHGEI